MWWARCSSALLMLWILGWSCCSLSARCLVFGAGAEAADNVGVAYL